MVCQPLRIALLIGAITAVAVSPVRATHRAPKCCDPCGSAPVATSSNCGPTAPATRTITVTECVPETYTVKRTAYKYECKTETYDACKTECVPVCKERTVTVNKLVPVVREEVRKVARNVTVYEDRTTMKTSYQTVQETVMQKKLVSRGHWECQEVAARHGLLSGLLGGGGHGHKSACSDPCADPCATPCAPVCTPTRTKKVWVHCPEYVECPVTVCKKVCVQTPVTCKVAVCKTEWVNETVKVCTTQCVPETRVEKYTVNETRQVTYKATRTVRVCVPYEETVNCTRMVARQVTREVPCAAPAAAPCSNSCNDACAAPRCGILSRLRGSFGSGCGSSCGHHTAAPSCCN
jgi:hypothetical protein